MKFMHISDVHLGVKPDQGKSWCEKRTRDIWDSFAETIQEAAFQKPDFLLISGDLFHGQPLKKELKEVRYLFEKIPDTQIILMAGNHDYMQQKSYYRTFEWPENVFFFQTEEVSCFDFPEKNVSVYGMSYWHREIRENLYDGIIPKNPGRINILLAHGGDERHIPFRPEQILKNGFDYVAAGHIHKGAQLVEGKAVMAGALEPTDCNDFGPHGYWLTKLDKSHTEVHFYPIKKCEYRQEIFPVTPDTSMRQLEEAVQEVLEENPKYRYFHVRFEGYINPDMDYDFSRIGTMDRIVNVEKHLLPNYDYERMQEESPDSLLGSYIRAMRNRPQDVVTQKALEYGVNALLGHQICR